MHDIIVCVLCFGTLTLVSFGIVLYDGTSYATTAFIHGAAQTPARAGRKGKTAEHVVSIKTITTHGASLSAVHCACVSAGSSLCALQTSQQLDFLCAGQYHKKDGAGRCAPCALCGAALQLGTTHAGHEGSIVGVHLRPHECDIHCSYMPSCQHTSRAGCAPRHVPYADDESNVCCCWCIAFVRIHGRCVPHAPANLPQQV